MKDETGPTNERAFLESHVLSLKEQLRAAIEEQAQYTAEVLLASTSDEQFRAQRRLRELEARLESLRASLKAEAARLRWLRS